MYAPCPHHSMDWLASFSDPAVGWSKAMHRNILSPSLFGDTSVDDCADDRWCHISEEEEQQAYSVQVPLASLLFLLSFSQGIFVAVSPRLSSVISAYAVDFGLTTLMTKYFPWDLATPWPLCTHVGSRFHSRYSIPRSRTATPWLPRLGSTCVRLIPFTLCSEAVTRW